LSKILVAEHENAQVNVLERALRAEGFDVVVARDDVEALSRVQHEHPDVVILDLMLPRRGGTHLCRRLQADSQTAGTPIIALSVGGERSLQIQALDAGADDCIAKPVHLPELIARIKALQRRTAAATSTGVLRAGLIEMDPERWTVAVEGREVTLTTKEFALLRTLLEARGRVLTREGLLETVWAHESAHSFDTRTVDVHIGRLRRKLRAAGHYIITVRNVGYRFEILPAWIRRETEC
jgi:DNA-binding response OmpR family regulator